MMTPEQEREKILSLVDKLTKKTRTREISWTHLEEGYSTPFRNKDTIEILYNFEEEDDEDPANFLLFFVTPGGVKYKGFYILSPELPGYSNFLSLYKIIIENEKTEFLEKYESFMSEADHGDN